MQRNLRIIPFDFFHYTFYVHFIDLDETLGAATKVVDVPGVNVEPQSVYVQIVRLQAFLQKSVWSNIGYCREKRNIFELTSLDHIKPLTHLVPMYLFVTVYLRRQIYFRDRCMRWISVVATQMKISMDLSCQPLSTRENVSDWNWQHVHTARLSMAINDVFPVEVNGENIIFV